MKMHGYIPRTSTYTVDITLKDILWFCWNQLKDDDKGIKNLMSSLVA